MSKPAPYSLDTTVEIFAHGSDAGAVEATISFNYTPRRPDYWCTYVGAHMPGDPCEVEVTGVTLARVNAKTGKLEPLVCPDWLGEVIIAAVDEDELVQSAIETEEARNWEDA